MKNRNLTNLSLIFPIFIIVFLILCPRYLMANEPEKSDPAVQKIIEQLRKDEGYKLSIEDINFYNIMEKNLLSFCLDFM